MPRGGAGGDGDPLLRGIVGNFSATMLDSEAFPRAHVTLHRICDPEHLQSHLTVSIHRALRVEWGCSVPPHSLPGSELLSEQMTLGLPRLRRNDLQIQTLHRSPPFAKIKCRSRFFCLSTLPQTQECLSFLL